MVLNVEVVELVLESFSEGGSQTPQHERPGAKEIQSLGLFADVRKDE